MNSSPAETRARLAAAGIGADDLRWLDSIGWSAAAVPPVKSEAAAEAYRRREAKLNAAVARLTYAERGESVEGKLAAALGARLADWREGDDDGE